MSKVISEQSLKCDLFQLVGGLETLFFSEETGNLVPENK